MYSVILFVSSGTLLSLLAEVEHCKNWFSIIPANGMRYILLYYLFPQVFFELASGGLTLPKLVFKCSRYWHETCSVILFVSSYSLFSLLVEV